MQRFDNPAGPIQVGAKEQFAIALAGNPTTGYEWQASVDPSYLELGMSAFESEGKAVGCGGREVFQFKALRVGETEVAFEYRRSWERAPLETRRCKLVIVDRGR